MKPGLKNRIAIIRSAQIEAMDKAEKIYTLMSAYEEKNFLSKHHEIIEFLDSKDIPHRFWEIQDGKLVKIELDQIARMDLYFPVVEALELCNNEELDNLIGTLNGENHHAHHAHNIC